MSLLKAGLIFIPLISNQVSLFRPSSPRNEEKKRAVDVEGINFIERTLPGATVLCRVLVGCILLMEAAISYAMTDPSNRCSRLILNLLCPAKSARPFIYISPLFVVGVATTFLGGLIRALCFREMGQLFTYELSLRDKHKLVTTGPYAVVRHPSYTGMLMVMAGITMCEGARGTWWVEAGLMHTKVGMTIAAMWFGICAYVGVTVSRAGKEDEMLQTTFEKEWNEYASRVRYRMLPGFF